MRLTRLAIALLLALAFGGCTSGDGGRITRTDGAGGPIAFVASMPKPQPTFVVSDLPVPPDPEDVYSVSPDGSGLRRLTTDGGLKGALAWSPDGGTLAYTMSPIGARKAQLWLTDSHGQNARLVCDGCGGAFGTPGRREAPYGWVPRLLAWSPSGRWIVTTASRGGLAVIDPSSARVTVVPGDDVGGVSWSPDSASIAFSVNDGTLDVYEVASGDVRSLASGDRLVGGPLAWSPDGSSIAYVRSERSRGAIRQGVFAIDPTGHHRRTLLDGHSTFGVYDLQWSPSGTRLAATYHPIDPPTASLLTMAPDGSDVRLEALCENGVDSDGLCAPNDVDVRWSPDGTSLVFENWSEANGLTFVVLTDGSAVTVSATLVPQRYVAWQPQAAT